MPGLVGIITKRPRHQVERELKSMVAALRHDPSYVIGTWCDEGFGLYAGWAERNGSFSDGMPIISERKDVVLLFSGEEYPVPNLIGNLRERGHRIERGGSSYLVHAYEENPAFFAALNGRFHGLLSDKNRGTIVLFNDRYGMGRLYYTETEDSFYFAAEAKTILAVRPELREIDARSLGEFIACGCVLENRTLFKGIKVIPCASAWTFREGSLESKGRYFEPGEWEDQPTLDAEQYYQELRSVFTQNLNRYFGPEAPVGMSLTGGLDTRMIMACHNSPPGALPCYSFGGMFRDCQDVILAREIARACDQPYEVIPVGREFLSNFPHYSERTVYLTDGCVDVSHSPDLFANERAKQIAPVRMTGNYGSEVLRGSRAFKPVHPAPGVFTSECLSDINLAAETYKEVTRTHPLSFAVFRQAPWHHYGLLALEQTQLTLRAPFLDNDLVRTVFRAPKSALVGPDVSLRLIADGSKKLMRIRTDRGLAGEHQGLSAAFLRQYLEFTAKAEYAYDYGMPQWVTKIDRRIKWLHPEKVFLGRHKFYHFRVWYREFLCEYVQAMLLDERSLSRPYVGRRAVQSVVRDHIVGAGNFTLTINKLLTLELIHRLFIDSPSPNEGSEPVGISSLQFQA